MNNIVIRKEGFLNFTPMYQITFVYKLINIIYLRMFAILVQGFHPCIDNGTDINQFLFYLKIET